MIEDRLIEISLWALSALVVLLVSVWSLHAVWRTWRGRTTMPAVDHARRVLLQDLIDGRISPNTEATVRSLPHNQQMMLLAHVGRQIYGRQRELLRELAISTGLYARAEEDCRSPRWPRRLRGADVLTLLGGGKDVVAPLLSDPSVHVRARAAEWAVEHPDPDVLDQLLDLFDDPEPAAQFAAADAALRVGPAVIESIADRLSRATLAEGSSQATVRLLDVAAGIRHSSFIEPALRLTSAEDPEVRSRAVALLGLIGGQSAVGRAIEMLQDPADDVRTAAVRALGNLGYWPAAAHVGARLADSSWEVRRAAGLALRAMGPPGKLVLQRATREEDRFAADMARLTLALPDA